ncbi:MAG: GntR family transcriptional regulator [Actinomycetota bacterium]|nr:GntR family transcriptional regulator [Actinomycetota bacterium]
MLVRIDHSAVTPLYAQIVAEVRAGVASGTIPEGQRLPAARDLAESLDVNMHTVLRAYAALKEEGLLQVRQGRGAVVAKGGKKEAGRLHRIGTRLLDGARDQGLSKDDLLALIQRM